MRARAWIFWLVLVVLILALLVDFPMGKGALGHRGVRLGLDLQGGTRIVYTANFTAAGIQPGTSAAKSAIENAIAVLGNRINPLGVAESSVRAYGTDGILVEVPGKSLTNKEKEDLSRVVLLEFGELVTDNETFRWEDQLGKWKPATAVVDNQTLELTSQYFNKNTYVTRGNLGQVLLMFEWDKVGSQLSEQITSRLYPDKKPLGIFEGDQPLLDENDRPVAPSVQGVITDKGQIEGLSLSEATRLSQQLNAGILPVPLIKSPDELNVEPWLGGDFVSKSVKAGLIGILATMLFMIIYYRLSGFMASLALAYYAVLTLAIFKLLGVTLTLAGIGGFVLSVGMAIDANVLIFERMKEELWGGRTVGAALEAGFKRAWSAILDSNVTTILGGVILYWLGSSNIVASDAAKGFAVTLIIGVAVSMFTAITVTRTLLRPFVGTGLARRTSLFAPYQRKTNV
ncbi:MAG: protein translocase subunit SecD [Dehalococcoidales bacterium]|nr:protein translocase subunit SecD [Dehalococcoidales bacterium]